MKSFLSIVFLLSGWVGYPASLFAQKNITWDILTDVTYSVKFDEKTQSVVMVPKYGDLLTAVDGQVVEIKGYIIPLDTEGTQYILSAFPYSACFFCGNAAKESVVELSLRSGKARYKTDQVATFRGKFILNYADYGLNYRLENAEVSEQR
ncbi:MAG: DUF3299 domain-containing protein [Bacteroidia bacterium]|nr:DUF3299 domain-containing protein [Bacteroidia bacterium]